MTSSLDGGRTAGGRSRRCADRGRARPPRAVLEGDGYLDANYGDEPLEAASAWNWSGGRRARRRCSTTSRRRDGSGPSLALRVGRDGGVTPFEPPPRHGLPPTRWRMRARDPLRGRRQPARSLARSEDTPFYARSVSPRASWAKTASRPMHESLSLDRFARPLDPGHARRSGCRGGVGILSPYAPVGASSSPRRTETSCQTPKARTEPKTSASSIRPASKNQERRTPRGPPGRNARSSRAKMSTMPRSVSIAKPQALGAIGRALRQKTEPPRRRANREKESAPLRKSAHEPGERWRAPARRMTTDRRPREREAAAVPCRNDGTPGDAVMPSAGDLARRRSRHRAAGRRGSPAGNRAEGRRCPPPPAGTAVRRLSRRATTPPAPG